ncbi:ADP-ribose pyrophosphatase [Gluconobacter oxydans]|uniref:NUDIX hydrolase n=1 Tax=Gluconobacter thailandicus TaxID=257438 RepID=UPI00038010CB|nr:NUDIX domain-containing protein [Gluconobacter thailandicus]ANQ41672.1 ADP-ribose pyrophosphatase [Gluconobacter oxydans]
MKIIHPRTLCIASAIIIDNNERILLVRKKNTLWYMQAGGKIDTGETALQTVCRELHEELDVDVPEEDLLPLGTFTAVAANEAQTLIKADLFFLCLQQPVRANAEIAEVIWVTLKEAQDLPLAPLTRDYVLPLVANDQALMRNFVKAPKT